MKYLEFSSLWIDGELISPAFVTLDASGKLLALSGDKPQTGVFEKVHGLAIPGFVNAHSHAFQYGMAGHAEKHPTGTDDDFWTWREAMYRCALSYDPDTLQALAVKAYAHMARNGYTHVTEFHYQHHDPDGKPYANLAETSERLVAAAAVAGIRITLVPVFYQTGNFGREAFPQQRRFISKTVDDYFELLQSSGVATECYPLATLGFGVHSLRAVNLDDINRTFSDGPGTIPFHLHLAEQLKEVDDCLAWCGQRPAEWLLDHLPVNERFNLVHCTHLTDSEVSRLATSGANVVLCPGTEGNLGDGVFRLKEFAGRGGSFSIGTDSQISMNPLEDLRWLDYVQRLNSHRRNTFPDGAKEMLGQLWRNARKATGRSAAGKFVIGESFDAVVYDLRWPLLADAAQEHLLPVLVYTADPSAILGTMVNGAWIFKQEVTAT